MFNIQVLPDANVPPKAWAVVGLLLALYVVYDKGWGFIRNYRDGQAAKRKQAQEAIDREIAERTSGTRQIAVDWEELAKVRLETITERDRTIREQGQELAEERRLKVLAQDRASELSDFNFVLQGELVKTIGRVTKLEELQRVREELEDVSRPPRAKRHD